MNILITFIINKFTDYNHLQSENKRLKQDIYNLVIKENDLEGLTTKVKWNIIFRMSEVALFGSPAISTNKFKGISV